MPSSSTALKNPKTIIGRDFSEGPSLGSYVLHRQLIGGYRCENA